MTQDGMDATGSHAFRDGDRVCADTRPGFPLGTVLKVLDDLYVLVKWDGDVLETADHSQLRKLPSD
jgi:hypothetical protein